ncbi:MAG: hypothetical protein U1D55_09795 [Phycisphaerae bacterium]
MRHFDQSLQVDAELAEWTPSAGQELTPPNDAIDPTIDVVGTWTTDAGYSHARMTITRGPAGEYAVLFDSGGCLAKWTLPRRALYDRGRTRRCDGDRNLRTRMGPPT